jgi:hypothetical protein
MVVRQTGEVKRQFCFFTVLGVFFIFILKIGKSNRDDT